MGMSQTCLHCLISLYRIVVKTRRWYIKIFWHCIDICKVNAWILYRRRCTEQGILKKNQKSLLKFLLEIVDALICANKAAPSADTIGKPGRPPKRKSIELVCNTKVGRKPVTPCPAQQFHPNRSVWALACFQRS